MNQKRPVGRPPKGDKRLIQSSIRMTKDEWARVAKTAEALCISQSTLISLCLSEFLDQAVANEVDRRKAALDELALKLRGHTQ